MVPKVVVVTLNYNQSAHTAECVRSLLSSDYSNFSTLLIDNGSQQEDFALLVSSIPDDERLIIKRLEVNRGYVGGINYGLELGEDLSPDYYLIMNNDTLIDEGAIGELVECAERYERKAIVSGKIYNHDEKDTLQYIGQDFDPEGMLNQRSIVKDRREKDVGQYDEEREMGMLDDIFWLLPNDLYKKIGPYSDYFFLYGEQNDYGLRAMSEGYKFIYNPKAKLWHKGGITTCDGEKKSPKIEYWTTFAVLKLAVLHFPQSRSKPFIRKWILRKILKTCLQYMVGKTRRDNVKAVMLAYKHFRFWDVVRYKDNGYNPFM